MIWLIVTGVILGLILLIDIIYDISKHVGFKNYYKKLEIDRSLEDYTKLLLDQNGLSDVNVVKCGFFENIFRGNTYNVKKRTVFLSPWYIKRPTIYRMTKVCALVGLAKQDAEGEKRVKDVQLNRWTAILAGFFLPLALIGLLIDAMVLWPESGVTLSVNYFICTIIFSAIGLGLALFAFIVAFRGAKAYKKSLDIGKDLLLELNLLNENESKRLGRLIGRMKVGIYIDVLVNLLYVIYFVLRLVWGLFSLIGKIGELSSNGK